MARFKALPFLLAAAAFVSVAAPAEARRAAHGPERGLDSMNQPVVERRDFALELDSSGGRLNALERGRLRDWFKTIDLNYGDRIFVEDGSGETATGQDVARVAAEFGMLVNEGAPVTAGRVGPGTARVIVSRSIASVPGCPAPEGGTSASLTSPNYGCAVNSNFAAMVADPQDLVLGQAGSMTGDNTTATKAIRVYRETAPSGAKGLISVESRSH